MEDFEKNIYINRLFDLYGPLLSMTQQKMITLYYVDDLSLSEIAEGEKVSRNAVHDALKKGIDALEEYENKLHLLAKEDHMKNALEELKKELSEEDYEKVVSLLREE